MYCPWARQAEHNGHCFCNYACFSSLIHIFLPEQYHNSRYLSSSTPILFVLVLSNTLPHVGGCSTNGQSPPRKCKTPVFYSLYGMCIIDEFSGICPEGINRHKQNIIFWMLCIYEYLMCCHS